MKSMEVKISVTPPDGLSLVLVYRYPETTRWCDWNIMSLT